MDIMKNLIVKVEDLKAERKFEEAIKMLEENIVKYHEDYRLYEELSDIYLYN
jgi:hypothetical protein